MKSSFLLLHNLYNYIHFKTTIFVTLQPLLTWIIFFIFFILLRIYTFDGVFAAVKPHPLAHLINHKEIIIISIEAQTYAKEILAEYHVCVKENQPITLTQFVLLLTEKLNAMKTKTFWSTNELIQNEISSILMLDAIKALNEKNPEYTYLLLLQISYYKAIGVEYIESLPAFIKDVHNLNIGFSNDIRLGYLIFVLKER